MREILFRGKRVENGEWVYGGYYGICKITNKDGSFKYEHLLHQSNNEPLYMVDPETAGQCTGLTDNNGKRIFEGDIVTYVGEVCLVKWDDETAKFVLENENLVCDFEEVWCNRFKSQIEVIGNIHDNPKLLEVCGE